ncbi:MAG: hypothetical protein ACTSYX_02815 [Candidatus Thorarchaeota archaeon]
MIRSELDDIDGAVSRREVLARYLLVQSVLDQGPDIKGIRLLLKYTIEEMYANGVRFLHNPASFFSELEKFIDVMDSCHEKVKQMRAQAWAKAQNSSPSKYCLYFGQSMRGVVSIKQALQFGVARWGTPLALMLVLERRGRTLVDYVESYESAERMSRHLKSHETLGLGKMIGDKACHMFAKSYVHSLDLRTSKRLGEKGWSPYSFENPWDSNVGRVLFRSGWIQSWIDVNRLVKLGVIQRNSGKGGTHYIRVTNLRHCGIDSARLNQEVLKKYGEIVVNHLKTKKRWRKVEIQQIPNALLLDTPFGIGDFDDGLIHMGLEYCKNHSDPLCDRCPIQDDCFGYQHQQKWITDYRT